MCGFRSVVFVALLLILTQINSLRTDANVSCVFTESCVLPCSFAFAMKRIRAVSSQIYWTKTSPEPTAVYSFSFQTPVKTSKNPFDGRASLFMSQIFKGNASLRLSGVRLRDRGRYRCFIRYGQKVVRNTFINVFVKAPVGEVLLEQVGEELVCRSEGIYPKPSLTWSGSDGTELKTQSSQSQNQLYSVSSSVRLSDNAAQEEHSCNVSTEHSWRSATYRLGAPVHISNTEISLPCTNFSLMDSSLVWKFNHTQTILTQTGINTVYNETWRRFVKEVSESGLTLKGLSSDHQGVYSCVLSSDRETYISSTRLEMKLQRISSVFSVTDSASVAGVCAAVVVFISAVGLSAALCVYKRRKLQTSAEPQSESGSKTTQTPPENNALLRKQVEARDET